MAKSEQNHPNHDQIAQKAFELFEKSGRVPGRDMENWLAAESQLKSPRRETPASTQPTPPAPGKAPAAQPVAAQSESQGQSRGGTKAGNRPATRNGNAVARV